MSLIVEDGTGLLVAESYVSAADATAYHLAMGNTAWALLSGTNMEIALRRATQYIDTGYRFLGDLLIYNQALMFPRIFGDSILGPRYDGVWPVKPLKDACCELALRASSAALVTDVDSAGIKFEKVGPIETEFFRSQTNGQTIYSIVDNLLNQFTYGRGSIRLERAS